MEVSYTGTTVVFKPGAIVGGRISHDCTVSRAVGYYLEPLIWLAPFSKKLFHVTLNGVTNDDTDVSVPSHPLALALDWRAFLCLKCPPLFYLG